MPRNYQKKPRELNGWYRKQSHCKRGHEKTAANTSKAGQCKLCMGIWRKEHPEACKSIGRGYSRRRRMKLLYHLTEQEYSEMYARQNGLCALPSCGKPATTIDHCHILEKARGLLCNNHNRALGLFSDSPTLLREALDYLENFNGKQQLHSTKFD